MQVIEQRGTNRSAPATCGSGRERETRRWLYARRSVTQARWATAPLPRVVTLRTGWPRDAQSRLALLRRKPEINIGCNFRAHWRENLCVFVTSVLVSGSLSEFLVSRSLNNTILCVNHNSVGLFLLRVSLQIEYSDSKIISCA